MMFNLRRNAEKYPEPFPLEHFLLVYDADDPRRKKGDRPKPKPQGKSWQELKAIGQMMAAMYNALEDPKPKRRTKR